MIRRIPALLLSFAASLSSGQTSELYITQLDSDAVVVVQNGAVVRSWSALSPGENALAVEESSVRTAGNYWFGSGAGAEYDPDGNPLGATYEIIGGGNWFDGTTDGRHFSYAVQHNGDYNLYRFDRGWGTPEVLFNVGFATSGITLDVHDGTFWVCDSLSRLARHLDRHGAEISSFTADDAQNAYGIATDPQDGSLWIGGLSGVVYQYDTSGTLLSSVAVPGITSAFGMEFTAPARCWADFDNNAVLDTRDVLAFLAAWRREHPAADCDGNGVINAIDVICFLDMWAFGC